MSPRDFVVSSFNFCLLHRDMLNVDEGGMLLN
jgi:hypothetical protein